MVLEVVEGCDGGRGVGAAGGAQAVVVDESLHAVVAAALDVEGRQVEAARTEQVVGQLCGFFSSLRIEVKFVDKLLLLLIFFFR